MLLAMARRVSPLALAIVLVAAGLLATAWTTRRAINDAFAAVRDGEAFAVQQAVRADLADVGGPPTAEELAAILHDHASEGLVYLAMLDGRGRVQASAGTPLVERAGRSDFAVRPGGPDRARIHLDHVGSRVRLEMRTMLRKAWGPGRGALWVAMEIEPVHASELRSAARGTLAVGALGALALLAMAIWLVRAELRRRALERQRERERRLASLGEMSAVLAHEIRNPLASLKGNAQLLAASLPEGDKQRAKAERVVDEAVRLEKLTQDLLAFVRSGELSRTEVAPLEIARDAAAGFDDVTVEDAGAPERWSLDAPRIREVLVNLVDNGLAAGAPVRVRVAQKSGALVIEVADSGSGVKPEDRDKIFEPFFTGKTRGTGLGLAIAKRVVELHSGSIRVDEASGGGALFRIEIPHGTHPGR
jgi:two-component system, NtrC family, sensor histidine kinase HydH